MQRSLVVGAGGCPGLSQLLIPIHAGAGQREEGQGREPWLSLSCCPVRRIPQRGQGRCLGPVWALVPSLGPRFSSWAFLEESFPAMQTPMCGGERIVYQPWSLFSWLFVELLMKGRTANLVWDFERCRDWCNLMISHSVRLSHSDFLSPLDAKK